MQRSTLTTLAAVGALAAAFVTGTSIARSNRLAPDAAKIATVNIQDIFEHYNEREDKLKALQAEAAGLDQRFGTLNAQVVQERDAANKMAEGPAKDAAMEVAVDHDVQVQFEIKKAKAKLEKSQADVIRSIFDKIQLKATSVGDKAGFTMVMAADDWVKISPRASTNEATQVMSLRRFIYINKMHDITADVLKQLNDDYAASKPPAPPAPASGPGAPMPGTATPTNPPTNPPANPPAKPAH